MIPLQHGLILAAILFVLGLTGLLIRRNLLFMLISLEVMINAAALAFVVAGSYWGQADGQVMYILAITLAAARPVLAWHCCCSCIVAAILWISIQSVRCADEPIIFNNSAATAGLLAVGILPWALV